jgi:general secretion pathway protein E
MRVNDMVALALDESRLTVASAKPLHSELLRSLTYFTGLDVELHVATAAELKKLQALATQIDAPLADAEIADADDIERMRDAARDAPTIKLVTRLIADAVQQGASDIHIEPQNEQVRVRYRIDGALRTVENLPKHMQAGIVSRIKILARLNIAEQRLPQDGRMRVAVRGKDVDFRVSTAPVLNGESIALRILDRHEVMLDFASIGFAADDIAQLSALCAEPNGIVLVTGPTGSGKTTTLYAALSAINRPESKIFTVEDPVEYHLEGINQIQVKTQIGLDFAAVLRSVLRQDPDIVMVGEIRDGETAKIAIQAALTGHLVFSTLHTNSAAASVTRLLDMGVEDYLLASTLRGVVAQRLVRKLCPSCRKPEVIPAVITQRFQLAANTPMHVATGCAQCGGTGYRGRTLICEFLRVTPDVKALITRHASATEINDAGVAHSLLAHGIERVIAGETSLDEVMRVASEFST